MALIQTAAFTYTPLTSRRHIRVLEIASDDDEHAPIKAKVREVNLDDEDRVSYAALSYTWGSPDVSHTLLVDGAAVVITPNLVGALRCFRRTSCLRWIWVDAVCINQEDDQEKSAQIPLMANIFRDASRVVVWLGDETSTVHGMKAMRIASRRISSHEELSLEERLELNRQILKTLESPWFSRRWIIQEVALSPSVSFFCGPVELAWQRLIEVVQCAVNGYHPPKSDSDERDAETSTGDTAKIPSVKSVLTLWALWSHWSMKLSVPALRQEGLRVPTAICRLLHHFHDFACSDDRDRIFAMLGLAVDVNNNRALTTFDFAPDYTQSTEQVYTAFATAMVRRGMIHRVLEMTFARRPSLYPGLPSWVPDWRVRSTGSAKTWTSKKSDTPMPIQATTCSKYHIITAHLICAHHSFPTSNVPDEGSAKYNSLLRHPNDGRIEPSSTSLTQFRVSWASSVRPKGQDWATWATTTILDLWDFILDARSVPHGAEAEYIPLWKTIVEEALVLPVRATEAYEYCRAWSCLRPPERNLGNEERVAIMGRWLGDDSESLTSMDLPRCIFLCDLDIPAGPSASYLIFGAPPVGYPPVREIPDVRAGDAIVTFSVPGNTVYNEHYVVRRIGKVAAASLPSSHLSEDGDLHGLDQGVYEFRFKCRLRFCPIPRGSGDGETGTQESHYMYKPYKPDSPMAAHTTSKKVDLVIA